MIIIVDYNIGNVGAIQNMINKIGYECEISSDIDKIKKARKIILSGVGSFDNGILNLRKLNLIDILNKKVLIEKTPVLGICLGMQLMASKSEEGIEKGLNWISQDVKKINPDFSSEITIPILGWNYVKLIKKSPIIYEINPRYYFVHSYYFPKNTPGTFASANIGFDYCVGFQKENIFGVQFHPEKSHIFGKKLLKNFCKI